jgi:hypothetical protein
MVAKNCILWKLMESNRPRKYKFSNKRKKIYMDWSHTKKRGWGNTKGCLTMESGKQEESKTKE